MATVTVACNIPGGLVLGYSAAPNGSYTVPVALAGPPVSGGYGITGIDATFWANWMTASQTPGAAPGGGLYYGNGAALASGAVWEI